MALCLKGAGHNRSSEDRHSLTLLCAPALCRPLDRFSANLSYLPESGRTSNLVKSARGLILVPRYLMRPSTGRSPRRFIAPPEPGSSVAISVRSEGRLSAFDAVFMGAAKIRFAQSLCLWYRFQLRQLLGMNTDAVTSAKTACCIPITLAKSLTWDY